MTLVLLLVLAGPLETTALHKGEAFAEGLGPQVAPPAQGDRAAQPFRIAPLASGPGVVFAVPGAPATGPKPKAPDAGVTQLHNERTGFTCTLLVVRAEPSVDTKMVGAAPGTADNSMVRKDLSPCVE